MKHTFSMKPRAAITAILVSLAGLCSVACDGELANDHTGARPLATIRGQLTTEVAPTTKGRLSMAVYWDGRPDAAQLVAPVDGSARDDTEYTETTCEDFDTNLQYFDGTPWLSSTVCNIRELRLDELVESVHYKPDFPLRFEIPVRRLPPKAARVDLSMIGKGKGTFAMGSIVAFVDADHDGEFDLGEAGKAGEEGFASSIGMDVGSEGRFESYWVVYLNGKIDLDVTYEGYREALAAIPQGFSFWHTLTIPAEDPTEQPMRVREILPIDTTIKLEASADLKKSPAFCDSWEQEIQYIADEFVPTAGYKFCWDGGREYEARQDRVLTEPCRFRSEYFRRSIADLSDSEVPADWQCTLD